MGVKKHNPQPKPSTHTGWGLPTERTQEKAEAGLPSLFLGIQDPYAIDRRRRAGVEVGEWRENLPLTVLCPPRTEHFEGTRGVSIRGAMAQIRVQPHVSRVLQRRRSQTHPFEKWGNGSGHVTRTR